VAELDDDTGPTGSVEIVLDDAGNAVVRITGEVDMANADSLEATIAPILTMRSEQLVFDVGDLDFMDSSGIALLLRCAKKVGTVRLRHPSPIIRRTVETMGLANVLHLDP